MITDRPALLTATALITFLAITNLIRLFWNISIYIGSFHLPGWTGLLFFLGLGTLAIWAWKELTFFHPPTNSSDL